MDKIIVNGGKPLFGEVEISGTKNAATAIILGCLLVEGKCVLENIPEISDVDASIEMLEHMGSRVKRLGRGTYEIDASGVTAGASAPTDLIQRMRSSYYTMGAQLGRFGHFKQTQPGGCNFGARPIDLHLKGFRALGASVDVVNGYYEAVAPEGGLKGAQIFLDKASVGATINIILAAARTPGTTVIENPAKEPHVVDLANFLNACGARVSGAGTDVIKIRGVNKLYGCTYAIIPDMIEAGTFMAAAAATRGTVRVSNVIPKHLESISAKLIEMGVDVTELDDAVIVSRSGELTSVNVNTFYYPGVPTDMNPQMCVLMCLAKGAGIMTEGVFDNRFQHSDELTKMGANIKVDGRIAVINGTGVLKPAVVRAPNLRAGIAMILAGLAAEGRTEIEDIYHIERGYEDIVDKFRSLGADITKVSSPDPDYYKYEQAN